MTTTDTAAMQYAGLGWHIIPIETKSKNPGSYLGMRWQHRASSDEDVVAGWWEQWPDANIGLLLGPSGGVIDVEYDTEDGKKALDKILTADDKMTPSYQSFRSLHRLYQWDDRLDFGVKKIDGIEFRAGGAGKGIQSVLPPSVHPDGGEYTWVPGLSPGEVELRPLPESVITMLMMPGTRPACGPGVEKTPNGSPTAPNAQTAKGGRHWRRLAAGVPEGERADAVTGLAGILLRNLKDLYDDNAMSAVRACLEAVNSQNRPPLQGAELHKHIDGIIQAEGIKRAGETYEERVNPKTPKDDRLEILKRKLGNLPLDRIIKHGREDSDFVLVLTDGRRIMLGAHLLAQDSVRELVMYATCDYSPCIAIRRYKAAEWLQIVTEILEVATTQIDTDGESRDARIRDWLASYVLHSGTRDEKGWRGAILDNSPAHRDGRWYVRIDGLMLYLKRNLEIREKREYIIRGVQECGWTHKKVSLCDEKGKKTSKSCWREPMQEVEK